MIEDGVHEAAMDALREHKSIHVLKAPEKERVREEIAKIIREAACYLESLEWDDLDWEDKEPFLKDADRILAINGIEIRADDQSLPEIPSYVGKVESGAKIHHKAGQNSMLKPDSEGKHWLRVIPKEK